VPRAGSPKTLKKTREGKERFRSSRETPICSVKEYKTMEIKSPVTVDELLKIVAQVEAKMCELGDVTITREEAAELCDACRNFMMIKVLTEWGKK
jgi:hypothetical protein